MNLGGNLMELLILPNIEPLEAMEFYEQEVERINKLFNYPAEQLKESV
jgi:hypothetical protein